ncbi:MAG: DegV family protein, partial [Acutalibacteraceae bacterium]|nr:DegV family protein [Acutalibacteraceae bacterium]
MSKIAITTDTNSGITPEEAGKHGIPLLAMPIIIDGQEYFEGVDITYDEFFERLANGADVSTSQPSVYSLTTFWDNVLNTYDY